MCMKGNIEARKKNPIIRLLIIFAVIEIVLSFWINYKLEFGFEQGKFVVRNVKKDISLSEKVNEQFQQYKMINLFGKLPINWSVVRVILVIDILLILVAFLTRKSLREIPSKLQSFFELIYSFFREIVEDSLGKEKSYFTPYIITIFIFILSCNIIGMVPIPGNLSPTQNLNVPLGMGIAVIFVVHFSAIKEKGLLNYVKGYAEPLFFLLPLNIVGELAKAISISFRLFGNILGGAIIILVISNLIRYVILPVGLNMFFGLFIGIVQAFVFTMLALSYTAVAIK